MNRKNIRPLSAIVAAFALAAAAPSFAGEALPEELPSMRTPIADYVPDGVTSRAEVRQQLLEARHQGALSMNGEAGDTERVIAARDAANAEQAREIVARYEAEAAAQVALAEAEARRMELENEAQIASMAEEPTTESSSTEEYAVYSPGYEMIVIEEPVIVLMSQSAPL
jgi:hypothetical protein